MNSTASPIQESERLGWIDAARGFAILGIFMVNVPAFNAPYFLYGGAGEYWDSALSHFVQAFIDVFFQASFYTLFSFMFGFGLQTMKERLEEKHLSYRPILFRRLLVLIGFGMIHAFLLWHGDILLSYGVIGMVLFAFFSARPRTLITWSLGMLAVLVIPMTLSLYALRSQLGGSINERAIEQAKANYGNGSLLDIWQQNLQDWMYANSLGTFPFLFLSLTPVFLIGMYVYKKGWLHNPKAHASTIKKVWIVTGFIFFSCKAAPYFFGNPEWFQLVQDNVGGTASAIFYVLSITLLFQTKYGYRVVSPLTWVGRMSLSNYILQSLFSFLLFYSVGFGFYGEIPPVISLLIVLFVFVFQVYASKAWLRKYRYGPLEWFWRTLTYRKNQPLKREI